MSADAEGVPEAANGAPHILMIVGNDITTDTRVKKTALSMARAGARVTVLGLSTSAMRTTATLGPVEVLRVPVDFHLRDTRAKRRARRRRRPLLRVGFPDQPTRRAAALRVVARRTELDAARGQASAPGAQTSTWSRLRLQLQQTALRGRALTLRLRERGQRDIDRATKKAWRLYDGVLNRTEVAASWRRVVPEMLDYERAFGPVIDELAPDVIHAHDVHIVAIAHNAVGRAAGAGRTMRWVYDSHEFVPGLPLYGGRTARVRAGYGDLEREYIGSADRVITVSAPIAQEIAREFRLPRVPDVVMNIPSITGNQGGGPLLRQTVGLADGVPLLVYSGGMTPARGVGTIIEALPSLPGVHLAIVAVPARITPFVQSLLDRATALGVGDRVHVAPPVASEHVVGYLSSATVGVHPMVHFPSHDMALPNKLFEYLHARIPVVVSDCRVMADFVRTHGHGEVFVAEDPDDLAVQVKKVLADLPRYQGALTDHPELFNQLSWATQEKVLWAVYRDLLGETAVPVDQPVADLPLDNLTLVPGSRRAGPPVVGFGPANMAGQAWEWAKALERSFPQVTTEVVSVDRGSTLSFPADVVVPQATWARDTAWQGAFEEHVLSQWSHVLLEAGRPIIGRAHGRDFAGDAAVLRQSGLTVGLLFHGSEVRDPRRHALRHRWSPYANPNDELTARLQEGTDALLPKVRAFDGPMFVSTPDLLIDLPDATWLPVVVDVDVWRSDRPVLERELPVVLHAPSRAAIKGTAFVQAVVEPLVTEGLIQYRRLENVPPGEMPAAVADADIVLDQFALGSYGVLAVQALAAGRLVIGHVVDEVRDHVLDATGQTLPIIEADPDTLTQVLRDLLSDRSAARQMAKQGPSFVDEVHSGALAARILSEVLQLDKELTANPD